ncbi:hypothetical protein [Streptomyces orinoci]|uniref:Secreted protein n=1 Tax=Streptomyces orinoci TaxID=67339 RepID=A0ABV3K6S1_STRON|nr:hypothetical protein [Streptomyces orinoci]
MRRLTIALAAAVFAVGGLGASAASAASPRTPRVGGDQPPFPYADCIKAAKNNGESAAHAKWHCDELVKKGWVKRPKS